MKGQKLLCIQRVEKETEVLSISRRDKYKGYIRRQYAAFLESSDTILKEVERLEGIIYPQFLTNLRNGDFRETCGISTATAHAGYPIRCPRTNFKNLPSYNGEVSSIFGANIEQIIYDEIWMRSRDEDFRKKVIIPNIITRIKNWFTDRERWQESWQLTIHSHYRLPHIEADFWIGSQ